MKKTYLFTFFVLFLLTIALIYSPVSVLRQRTAVCRLTVESYYALPLPAGDTLYLSTTPHAHYQVGTTPDSVVSRVSQSAVWVSPAGHVITSAQVNGFSPEVLEAKQLKGRLQKLDSLLHERLISLGGELKELDYYAERHSVVDDGYNEVMGYRTYVQGLFGYIDSTLLRLAVALQTEKLHAQLFQHITLSPAGNRLILRAHEIARKDSLLLLQTEDALLPSCASFLPIGFLSERPAESRLVGYNDWGTVSLSDSAWLISKEGPVLPAAEGGAWVNHRGYLGGVNVNGTVQKLGSFIKIMGWSTPLSWLWAFNSVPGKGFQSSSMPHAPSVPCISWVMPDSTVYVGQMSENTRTGKKKRNGVGIWTASDGTRYIGTWRNDTIPYGVRIDSMGTYEGTFDRHLRAHGLGRYHTEKGEFYFGGWRNDLRHGWGFSSSPGKLIHSGVWRRGQFRGERVVYTPDRVYGIDISRYQHEIKGRVYGIDWKNLRITYLAKDRPVQGEVDYPVSYVYIKSTQGDDIVNKYYRNDTRQARKHDIPVGCYHFFSTKMSGARQAAHFLKHSSVHSSDLPPMLDVEPSDRRVAAMGGDSELVKQMKIWLEIVEKATGKRPVIYSYQKFIDDHLASNPQLLHDYPVWVARYGVYKPYYRLLHWQLSPAGRVRGIKGPVDINVFNGTKEQFRAYLEPLSTPD